LYTRGNHRLVTMLRPLGAVFAGDLTPW